AAYWNMKARDRYARAGHRPGEFLATHNLMVDLSRIGNQVLAQAFFKEARALVSDPAETMLLFRARACEASRQRNYVEACAWLDKLMAGIESMRPHDREITYNVAADIYFRAGRYEDALRVLKEQIARSTRNRDRGRLIFEQAMIEFKLRNG